MARYRRRSSHHESLNDEPPIVIYGHQVKRLHPPSPAGTGPPSRLTPVRPLTPRPAGLARVAPVLAAARVRARGRQGFLRGRHGWPRHGVQRHARQPRVPRGQPLPPDPGDGARRGEAPAPTRHHCPACRLTLPCPQVTLYESQAICQYLAELLGGPMGPQNGAERARINMYGLSSISNCKCAAIFRALREA